MARLESSRIPASSQLSAVAWLRWRLFVNGFRRKGGTGELVARIVVFPFAALFVIGPVAGSTAAAYFAATGGHLEDLTGIFWGIFLVQILVSINISQPGLSFDPESLIRYPVSFARYLTIRLFLGLLSASAIVGTLALLGAATGIAVAVPKLAAIAYAAAVSLAVCNVLFVRMVFAWVDRWLSTRRAREIFTGLIILFSIGVQYVNVTVNGVGNHLTHAERQAKLNTYLHFYRIVEPYLHVLPPGLAGSAVISYGHGTPVLSAVLLVGILLIACLFFAIFGWRMNREYRGENLTEAGQRAPETTRIAAANRTHTVTELSPSSSESPSFLLSPVLAALFEKEWIYVRRNPAQFYGFIAPLAIVLISAGRMGTFARTGFLFPAAVAYSILGVAALAYNVLGLDANGIQFYLLAPIQMRSVILAKNLFSFSITLIQLCLVYVAVSFIAAPPPFLTTISTACWVVLACLVNVTIGNMRSIIAPKKIDPSKVSRKQASQLSALICIGIMLVIGAVGAGIMALGQYLGMPWLPIPILAALSAGAFALYLAGLNGMDHLALKHRESLVEELCKAS